jgi:hypothetical protein
VRVLLACLECRCFVYTDVRAADLKCLFQYEHVLGYKKLYGTVDTGQFDRGQCSNKENLSPSLCRVQDLEASSCGG